MVNCVGRSGQFGSSGRKMLREAALGRLVLGQHFAGAHHDFVRQSGQLGDFDSVAAVGCARLDSAQENYASAGFFHRT